MVSLSLWPVHVLPPKSPSTSMWRVRALKPLPQVMEQSFHDDHDENLQCTGQFF